MSQTDKVVTDEQLRADIPASEGENDSDDDETLDEILRAQREAKIRERKQQEESAAVQEIIARLHSSSSPVMSTITPGKSTVTPGKSTVTPQKRRSLVDEVEILSSGGVWTGLAKRRKTSTVLPAPSTSQPAIAKREGRPPKNTICTLTLPK
ncbi:hypothetical protein CALVIDRAFT_568957 [Calocera viscosa TUFC12733]|uniref:Uncharacterized protein n=1 Tax=Calocera viscosa (strain TUFC12733) TaxID=1330018 RepID=A0A167GGN1_CALVF|nr:hypothetical protein CALVIDRAFT_568957 [Calocera viscosa TUFC12733]